MGPDVRLPICRRRGKQMAKRSRTATCRGPARRTSRCWRTRVTGRSKTSTQVGFLVLQLEWQPHSRRRLAQVGGRTGATAVGGCLALLPLASLQSLPCFRARICARRPVNALFCEAIRFWLPASTGTLQSARLDAQRAEGDARVSIARARARRFQWSWHGT